MGLSVGPLGSSDILILANDLNSWLHKWEWSGGKWTMMTQNQACLKGLRQQVAGSFWKEDEKVVLIWIPFL